jgi:hypothetical protein
MFRDDASSSSTSRFYVFLRCSIMNDERFEGLRYVSDQAREEAGLPSDWPAVQPMVMR